MHLPWWRHQMETFQINENIKAPRHWSLWGEFTGEFPAQMASNAENVSIWLYRHGHFEWRQRVCEVIDNKRNVQFMREFHEILERCSDRKLAARNGYPQMMIWWSPASKVSIESCWEAWKWFAKEVTTQMKIGAELCSETLPAVPLLINYFTNIKRAYISAPSLWDDGDATTQYTIQRCAKINNK